MERVSVADLQSLQDGRTVYSFLPNSKGGFIDDCMISRRADHIYLVVNAGCADKDWEHLTSVAKEFNVQLTPSDDALIALQGPKSQKVLQSLVSDGTDLEKMEFLTARNIAVRDLACGVTRSGYTGEDGFEISVAPSKAARLWNFFLEDADVKAAGLAVRDSLRLECGLTLYGHEIDETTTPAEAALIWPIAPRRRQNGGFIGADVILGQIASKQVEKKRVSILFKDRGIPREGSIVLDNETHAEIGAFTSGTFSPTLRIGMGMAYVKTKYAAISTPVKVKVRDNIYEAKVVKAPIVPTHYHTVKK
jgi:aminomethyltransferase